MTLYFRLVDQVDEIPNRWHLHEVLLPSGEEPRLYAGLPLHETAVLKTYVHHQGVPLDFCLTSFNVPVATKSLAQEISKVAGDDVQCLPLAIEGFPDRVALNAVRLVQCVDEAMSVYTKWTEEDFRPDRAGQFKYFDKLVLNPIDIPEDAHFFRIKGWTVPLIVSEDVKNAMERVGCFGAKFIELETTS